MILRAFCLYSLRLHPALHSTPWAALEALGLSSLIQKWDHLREPVLRPAFVRQCSMFFVVQQVLV